MTTATRQPPQRPLPHDATVERAVLALIFVSGHHGLIDNLDAADFYNPLHAFLFTELRLMAEAGEPLGNAHAALRWFRQPVVLRRSGQLLTRADVAGTIADICTEFATVAHEAFYMRTLRRERLRRSLRHFARAIDAKDAADPENPMATLKWLSQQVDLLYERAADVFPEEMNR